MSAAPLTTTQAADLAAARAQERELKADYESTGAAYEQAYDAWMANIRAINASNGADDEARARHPELIAARKQTQAAFAAVDDKMSSCQQTIAYLTEEEYAEDRAEDAEREGF